MKAHTTVLIISLVAIGCGGGSNSPDLTEVISPIEGDNLSTEPDVTLDVEASEGESVSIESGADQGTVQPSPDNAAVNETQTTAVETTETEMVPEEISTPVSELEPLVPVGFSNQVASCELAGTRIQESIELGMSEAQVLSIVGRPLGTGPSGDRWEYGRLGDPMIRFQPLFLDGRITNGPVVGFDSDMTRCDYYQAEKDVPLIESANSLASEESNTDFTNETPTCLDAGIRTTARVDLGMTPEEVRGLVGKPIEIKINGTIWDYGDGTFTPEIWFGSTIESGLIVLTAVQGWDGDIRGCE